MGLPARKLRTRSVTRLKKAPKRPACYIDPIQNHLACADKGFIMDIMELNFASQVRNCAESIRDHHMPLAIANGDDDAYYEWMDAHPIAGYIQEAYREIEEAALQIRAIRAG